MTGWWFGTLPIFHIIGNVINPIDYYIFFGGVGLNRTRYFTRYNQTSQITNHQPGCKHPRFLWCFFKDSLRLWAGKNHDARNLHGDQRLGILGRIEDLPLKSHLLNDQAIAFLFEISFDESKSIY